MANETVVRVTADASGYMAELTKAKTSAQAFAVSQDALSARIKSAQDAITEATANGSKASTRSVNAFMTSLARQAEQAGRTRAEVLQMQAAMLGVSDAAKKYVDAIAKADAANSGGHSGGVGARREMLVMAHEAFTGNIKNLAGSSMVLAERFDLLTKLTNPVALGVAAIAAVAIGAATALNSVQKQVDAFNNSLKLTNDWSNVTYESVGALAQTVAGEMGTSFGTAQQNIMATVASGRVLGEDLKTVTEIAMDMAKQTGESFDKALEKVVEQSENVQKAAQDWQKSHHDMSDATLAHIKALDEAGDHTTALRILYQQELDTMQASTNNKVGLMSSIWNSFLDSIGRIGRQLTGNSTPADELAGLKSALKDTGPEGANAYGVNTQAIQAKIDAIEKVNRAQQALTDQQNKAKAAQQSLNGIQEAVNKELEKGASNAEKRAKAEAAANAQYKMRIDLAKQASASGKVDPGLATQFASERDRQIANADREFKDPKVAKPKEYHDDAATTMAQQLRDQHASLQAQLETDQKLSNAEQELAKFNQQISDWKGKTLTDAQKSLVAHQDELRTLLQQNAALDKQLEQRKQIDQLHERAGQIGDAIGAYQTNQREQYSRELDAYGMGTEAQRRVQGERSIYSEYNRQQEQLTKATPAALQGSDDYKSAVANIQAGLQQSLQLYDQYYADLKQKQSDWRNGVATAMQDYVDQTANAAKSAQQAFESATQSMEDAITKFVTTGKINLQSLAQTIETSIVRNIVKQGMSGLFSNGASILGSLFGGQLQKQPSMAANVASTLPGDSLDNMMKLTKGFGTMGNSMGADNFQSAIQGALSKSAAITSAAAMTVGTMTVGAMIGGGDAGGDTLGNLLGGLGDGDMAGSFGFTSTGVTGSVDAVANDAGVGGGLSTLFGPGGSSAFADLIPKFAGGGDVTAGQPYYVGEQGPELFVPGAHGSIVPHHALLSGGSSGAATPAQSPSGHTFNINVAVPPGTTRQTASQQATAIMLQANIAMARNG